MDPIEFVLLTAYRSMSDQDKILFLELIQALQQRQDSAKLLEEELLRRLRSPLI